ncbi:AAA family ATPase [Frateuria aurantia]
MSISPPTSSEPRAWFVYAPRNAVHEVLQHASAHDGTGEWIDSGTISAEALARQLPPAAILLVKFAPDLVETATEACRFLSSRRPDIQLVAVGLGTEGSLVLAAMRAGAREYMDVGAPPEEIRHHLLQILRQPREEQSAGSSSPEPRTRSNLILVIGTRAGTGCSTLAAHFAALAQQRRTAGRASDDGRSVLLLDLGRPAGDAYLNLGLTGSFHYDDALRDVERLDATLVRAVMAQHASGLRVLSQPPDTLEPPRGGPMAISLIDRLRRHTSLLVVDLGGLAANQIPPPLLQAADRIWLVTSPDLASVLSLDQAVRHISPNTPRDQRLGLIVNRYNDDTGIEPKSLAGRFGLPLLAVIPECRTGLRSSINQGKLLHELHPGHRYLRALDTLLATAGLPASRAIPWFRRLRPSKPGKR